MRAEMVQMEEEQFREYNKMWNDEYDDDFGV